MYPIINLMGGNKALRNQVKKTASTPRAAAYTRALEKLSQAAPQITLQEQMYNNLGPVRDSLYLSVARQERPDLVDDQQLAAVAASIRQQVEADVRANLSGTDFTSAMAATEAAIANNVVGSPASAALLSRVSTPEGSYGLAAEVLGKDTSTKPTTGEMLYELATNASMYAAGTGRLLSGASDVAGVGGAMFNAQDIGRNAAAWESAAAGAPVSPRALDSSSADYAVNLFTQAANEAAAMGVRTQRQLIDNGSVNLPVDARQHLEQQERRYNELAAESWVNMAKHVENDATLGYQGREGFVDAALSMANTGLARAAMSQTPRLAAGLQATIGLGAQALNDYKKGGVDTQSAQAYTQLVADVGLNYGASNLVRRTADRVLGGARGAASAGSFAPRVSSTARTARNIGLGLRGARAAATLGTSLAVEAAMPSLQQGANRLAEFAFLPSEENQRIHQQTAASRGYQDAMRGGGPLNSARWLLSGDWVHDLESSARKDDGFNQYLAGNQQAEHAKDVRESAPYVAELVAGGMPADQAFALWQRQSQITRLSPEGYARLAGAARERVGDSPLLSQLPPQAQEVAVHLRANDPQAGDREILERLNQPELYLPTASESQHEGGWRDSLTAFNKERGDQRKARYDQVKAQRQEVAADKLRQSLARRGAMPEGHSEALKAIKRQAGDQETASALRRQTHEVRLAKLRKALPENYGSPVRGSEYADLDRLRQSIAAHDRRVASGEFDVETTGQLPGLRPKPVPSESQLASAGTPQPNNKAG